MIPVNFSKMLSACHIQPRGDEISAFVHRTTGEVLFESVGDEVAAMHFPSLNLGKLRAAVAKSPDWLAVPKHNGPPRELKGFMDRWCAANGFTT